MTRTMFLALLGLAVAACAQPADQQDSQPLLGAEDSPSPDGGQGGGPDGGQQGDCAAQGDFDIEVFADEIMPILAGEIDLNDPDGEPFTGCTRAACHGIARPGGLHLDPADSAENNVERFACFVNLERPRRSQVLLCPSNDERCITHPHPGPELFTGPDDLNYKRILTYIRASRP